MNDSAYPFEPPTCVAGVLRRIARRIVGDQRDARYRARAASCRAGAGDAVRVRRRHRHHRCASITLDGTIGQGIGRFRLSATVRDPLVGADVPARLPPYPGDPGHKSHRSAGRGVAGLVPLDRAALKPARDGLATARKALADLQIPVDAGDEGACRRSSGPSYELRERGSFDSAGRARCSRARQLPCTRCATIRPCNRLGLARWLVDEATR